MSVLTSYIEAELATLPVVPVVSLADYGEDFDGIDGLVSWRIIRQGELLKQQSYRRMTTSTGSLFGKPWGMDVQEFLHSGLTESEMSGRVQFELARDVRLKSAECITVRRDTALRFDVVLIPKDLIAAGLPLTLAVVADKNGVTLV